MQRYINLSDHRNDALVYTMAVKRYHNMRSFGQVAFVDVEGEREYIRQVNECLRRKQQEEKTKKEEKTQQEETKKKQETKQEEKTQQEETKKEQETKQEEKTQQEL